MPIGQIPSWLRPHDFTGAARAGAAIGQQREQANQRAQLQAQSIAQDAAQAHARLAAQQAQLEQAQKQRAIESKVAQENLDRNFEVDQQRNAVTDARNQALFGLQEQKMEQDAKQAYETLAERKAYHAVLAARGGSADFETVREKFPAVPASEAVPGSPAGTGLFGTGLFARKAVAEIPAVAAQPERTITRKVPIGGKSTANRFKFNPDTNDIEPVEAQEE